MNIKHIKDLARIMESSGLTAIEVTEGDSRIRLEKSAGAARAEHPAVHAPGIPAAPAVPAASGEVVNFNNIIEVKSPMVGVFYASPTPDAEPFVRVGKKVKKGDVLCIVEAMKIMNEITSEQDGEIVDICVKNGEVVEFSQILFKIF